MIGSEKKVGNIPKFTGIDQVRRLIYTLNYFQNQ